MSVSIWPEILEMAVKKATKNIACKDEKNKVLPEYSGSCPCKMWMTRYWCIIMSTVWTALLAAISNLSATKFPQNSYLMVKSCTRYKNLVLFCKAHMKYPILQAIELQLLQ